MAGGRPTILTEELIENTKRYIESCVSGYVSNKKTFIDSNGQEKEKIDVVYEVNLPTIEGLAYELGINKDTIYNWRKGDSENEVIFSDLIEDLLHKQAKSLVNNGLSGAYNPTIAKVLLTKHGYREGTEHSGVEGKDLIPDKQSTEKADAVLSTFLTNGTNQGAAQ